MCGFSGIISNESIAYQPILSSLKSIKHRGKNDSRIKNSDKFWSTELSFIQTKDKFDSIQNSTQSQYWFGFNRLSIVDLSENAMQPFSNNRYEFMMVGEIYNYSTLREKFLSNTRFFSDSDSEVAFKLYQLLGNDFVQELEGMFTIVIFDKHKTQLKVWRDAFGIKPFYYSYNQGKFIFSSEICGIHETGLIEKQYNYQGLTYSMFFGTCPSPLTIYENINSLPAASFLCYDLESNELKIKKWWKLKYSKDKGKTDIEELNSDLINVAKLSTTGNVKQVIMQSGGLDSGLLAYALKETEIESRCLINSDRNQFNESFWARLNAENAKLNYAEYSTSFTFKKILDGLESEEEPNTVLEPAWAFSQQANQEGFKVAYSALGLDELFGGYNYFKQAQKYKSINPKLIPKGIFPSHISEKFNPIKEYGWCVLPFLSRQLFSWTEIKNYLKQNGKTIPEHPIKWLMNQVEIENPEFKYWPTLKQLSFLEFYYYISSHHVIRSDRPSMINTIEMRLPFLNRTFVQKYFNKIDTFKGIQSENKPMIRKVAKQVLPKQVLEMKKSGFTIDSKNLLNHFENKTPDLENTYKNLLKSNQHKINKLWYLLHLDFLMQ